MKRNIATTIQFTKKNIFFTVIETISTKQVEIFCSKGEKSDASSFIKEAALEAGAIVGFKISNVSVVVNSAANIEEKIKPYMHTIDIAGNNVSKKDVDNVISLSKINFESKERRVTLVQPVKFEVFDVLWKSYDKAPISKKGSKLKITSVVTTINAKIYDNITTLIESHNLKIDKVLLSQQAISQTNLSSSALVEGAVLIHVDEEQTFITINKNLSTIASMSIYDFGYKQLVTGIAKVFGIQKTEARDLITIHGSLTDEINRVITSRKLESEDKVYRTNDLNRIIDSFVSKLMLVTKQYLNQKNVSKLPIVISGQIEQLKGMQEYAETVLESSSISIYNPISFIEISIENKEAIGLTMFNRRIDEINGRQLNTIVETNPNLVSSLKKEKNINLFNKIIEKIGGKNVWK